MNCNILICKKLKNFCHSPDDYACVNSYVIFKEFKGCFDFYLTIVF